MSGAAFLRRAAKLMLERADEALCGGGGVTPWQIGEQAACGCCEAVCDGSGALIAHVDDRQSAHIASWHPEVAKKVAKWLEREAALIDAQVFPQSDPAMQKYPLAVARAYLGETGDDQ